VTEKLHQEYEKNTMKNDKIQILSRRETLKYALATPLLLTPLAANADRLMRITRLHPVRFIGGLIFDVAKSVVVDLIAEEIVEKIKEIRERPPVATLSQLPQNETTFKHPVYKRAVVRLGLCAATEHKQREIALQLVDSEQNQRFGNLRDYFKDEKIRVKLAHDSYSHAVTVDTIPDDLFTLDYIAVDEKHRQRHYENMIEISGVKVFDEWYS